MDMVWKFIFKSIKKVEQLNMLTKKYQIHMDEWNFYQTRAQKMIKKNNSVLWAYETFSFEEL